MAGRGMKGRGTGLGSDDPKGHFPGVLFQPQESGPTNKANAKAVDCTPFYYEKDMPTFRPRGANDEGT